MDLPETTRIFKDVNGAKSLAISYSQLDMFLKCPERWKKCYWDGVSFGDGSYEALEYGSCIHETYEYYAKNKAIGRKVELAEIEGVYSSIFEGHEIPFETQESKEKAWLDGSKAIKRLSCNDGYVESLINKSTILAVEEEFILPVNHVVEIGDDLFDCVYIFGAIDLVLEKSSGDIIIVDHKSGKKKFAKDKLAEDLQFPIYGRYILEKYGRLPKKCLYNFTRLGDFQEVIITPERLKEVDKFIKTTITRMYNGRKYKANPTPLCYWCDFSKTKHNICEFSSDWIPKDKREESA